MSSAETFTYATLSGAAGVTALVGSGAAARIYPDEAAQDAVLPLIVFDGDDADPVVTLNNTVSALRVPMNVTGWAATRLAAEALGDAVQAAMLAAGVPPAGRDKAFDPETNAYAAVLRFELWI